MPSAEFPHPDPLTPLGGIAPNLRHGAVPGRIFAAIEPPLRAFIFEMGKVIMTTESSKNDAIT